MSDIIQNEQWTYIGTNIKSLRTHLGLSGKDFMVLINKWLAANGLKQYGEQYNYSMMESETGWTTPPKSIQEAIVGMTGISLTELANTEIDFSFCDIEYLENVIGITIVNTHAQKQEREV